MFRTLHSFFDIARTIRNFPSVLFYAVGATNEVTASFRNGVQIDMRGKSELGQLYSLVNIALNSRARLVQEGVSVWSLNLSGLQVLFSTVDRGSIYRAYVFSNLHGQLHARFPSKDLCEFYKDGRRVFYFFNPEELDSIANLNITFARGIYDVLDVKDRIVADVGAAYGDTALYFALKGAKRVYSYEPVPRIAETLRRNVEVNRLEGAIKVLPFAVSDREGEALMSVPRTKGEASLFYSHKDAVKIRVKMVIPPSDADVLKLNCAGCEYAIILKWLKSRLFNQIAVYYNAGHVQLVEKLRRLGYRVRVFPYTRMLFAT